MKILVTHSSGFDFENELYLPIKASSLYAEHTILLPQDGKRMVLTKEIIGDQDLIIAECSYPSTGQGIELGWASMLNVPILGLYKTDKTASRALSYVTDACIQCSNGTEMVEKIVEYSENLLK